MTPLKDAADVCQHLAPLGREKRLQTLRMWLFGEGLPEPEPLVETEWDREVWKAMLIARDYQACCALLRGESVPPERIDWEQAKRYGRVSL